MKVEEIETLSDANRFVEGVINDFEGGIIDKNETMRLLGAYTGSIMDLFLRNVKKNPKLLEE